MRTLMAVAAVLVLAVAGVGGYVLMSDDGHDPGDGGAGETGPQYTDADMRWFAFLEEVPTNEGYSTLIHPIIYCPSEMDWTKVTLEVEGIRGGHIYTLRAGTHLYDPDAHIGTVTLDRVTISVNGTPIPLDPSLVTG